MDHVDVNGLRVSYTRAGSGPALVMLHGAPSDSRTWQWMLPDLSRDHTVIAWDAPGFGESAAIDDSWRAPQFADALAAFVAALGLERSHLVGHSFGTMVALSLFRRHPAVPASLVLVGGYAGWAGSLPPDEVARRLEMFVGMAELGDAFDPKSYPGLFSDLIPADREAALVTIMRENVRPATIRAAGHIGAETDLRQVLPTIDVPTLVLHGEADARSPLANAEALHAAIPTSQLVVLPKLGHACVVEDPEACATEIRRFVKTVH
ncbi:MAG TPA: alpha/beta hydrolase [Jiangellaceae bacterium]|nr:alpha/beta hydrolase [Jiangellaceae bacterium]